MLVYKPNRPPLRLEDLPPSIQPHAVRRRFAGTGTAGAPLVDGWIVYSSGGPNGGLSHDLEAKAWLKHHGFKHRGRRWYLRDDVACGEDAFELAVSAAETEDPAA
jgi:hypothetical protein